MGTGEHLENTSGPPEDPSLRNFYVKASPKLERVGLEIPQEDDAYIGGSIAIACRFKEKAGIDPCQAVTRLQRGPHDSDAQAEQVIQSLPAIQLGT